MSKYTLAIIGMGRISPYHVQAAMLNSDDVKLVAVCDIEQEKIDESLQKAGYSGNVERYSDYKKMLYEIKPDITAIATPSGTHGEIGIDCLNAGCHVIIEKPMAMSIAQADLLIAKAEQKQLVLSVCHQNRFNKSILKIHTAVEQNRFGKLSHIAAHVRWNRGKQYYNEADWRGKWESDGGCLMNQCIHNIDLVLWILGDVDEVFAYTANRMHPFIQAEDLGIALLKGKSGAYALIEGTVNVYPKNLEETLYIFGENGTAKAAGNSVNLLEKWDFADGLDNAAEVIQSCNEQPANIYGFGHSRLYSDVIAAIKTKRKPLADGEAGKKAVEIVLAIYKSQQTGLPVKLPLESFACSDMRGEFDGIYQP
ncbi:MAG: Gfo/Idh/MocA family oxidoreductase [Oscillospiraceae bacterium]